MGIVFDSVFVVWQHVVLSFVCTEAVVQLLKVALSFCVLSVFILCLWMYFSMLREEST